jgi:hypothetical protein
VTSGEIKEQTVSGPMGPMGIQPQLPQQIVVGFEIMTDRWEALA